MNEISSESTRVSLNIQSGVEGLFREYSLLPSVIKHLNDHGARCYLVGGAVRDIILGYSCKDVDIEVHGIELTALEKTLESVLPVNLVGKSFGVLKSFHYPIDFSVPRSDSCGRHPQVDLDPHMGIESALKRRDLTMNAMAINLSTKELIDPFGGLNDIKNKILRAPDNKLFIEDPLRFYRVMQFAARFEMEVSPELTQVCKTMNIQSVSIERIETEFDKMFLQATRPSLGIRWLNTLGRLEEILPQLVPTISTKQEADWHPEIYVFEHLMQTLDAAARIVKGQSDSLVIQEIASRILVSPDHKLLLLYAALCHDLGKATTTRFIEGRLRSWGHAEAGTVPTKKLLKHITLRKKTIHNVAALVKYHMHPSQFIKQNVSFSAYKRLASHFSLPVNNAFLALLFLSDRQGRNGESQFPLKDKLEEALLFIEQADKAGVLYHPERPILTGQDLLDIIKPGAEMGKILKKAYQLQIDKNIHDKEILKQKVLKTT